MKVLILDTKPERAKKIKNILNSINLKEVELSIKDDEKIILLLKDINILFVHANDDCFHKYYLETILEKTVVVGYSGGGSHSITSDYIITSKKFDNYIFFVDAFPMNGVFSQDMEFSLKEKLQLFFKKLAVNNDKTYNELSDILNYKDVELRNILIQLIKDLELLGNNKKNWEDYEKKRDSLLNEFL